jgi:hypothetical protein
MSPKEIHKILLEVFAKGGTIFNGVTLSCVSPASVLITKENEDRIRIDFPENKPVASFKRFITFSATVQSITLKDESGFVSLKSFPSIPFGYDSFFFDPSSLTKTIDTTDIELEIDKKYGKRDQEIAKLCLHYAKEWATISSQVVCFENTNKYERRTLKGQCFDFVIENVKKNVEKRHGSIILTYIFLVLILPAVAKFIINKLLEKYF